MEFNSLTTQEPSIVNSAFQNIQVTISVSNMDKLKSLIKEAQGDFITLLFTPQEVYFVYNSTSLYIHHSFDVISRYNMTDSRIVRIDKKEFLDLIVEGNLTFNITPSEIKMDFYGKDDLTLKLYSFKTLYQEDLIDTYVSKIELFSDIQDYPRIELAKSLEIVKIAKTLGTTVACGKEYSQVNAKGVFIFKEDKSMDFTVDARMLDLLLKFGTYVYNVSNYIVYSKDSTCIAVVKHRHIENQEFEYINKQPSFYKIEFKCNHMLTLIKKLKLKEGTFYFDFENQECVFTKDRKSYTTPLNIIKSQSSKKKKASEEVVEDFDLGSLDLSGNSSKSSLFINEDSIPKLMIPDLVLKGVLNNLKIHDTLVCFIKKRFILLKVGEVSVAFRRSDLNE